MAAVALRLDRVIKHFGQVKAVDGLSLEIMEGEVFTLLGPSGCGKTTTIRLIAGLESPDDGNIFLGDRPVVSVGSGIFVPAHKRNLGMVFQSYAIWPHMTVFENVAYPLRVQRVGGEEIQQRVGRALEMVGLSKLEKRQAPQLSGGQQQRVALARALVYEPSLLLLDEPFSNLDAKLRQEMRIQLKLLLKRLSVTVVFVTHDQVEALSLSDRIVVMDRGRAEQVGSPQELYERPRTSFVRDFLGRTVLLKGRVSNVRPSQRIDVNVDGLPEAKLSVPCPGDVEVGKGNLVFLAIRPEDIQVLASAEVEPESNCIQGTVESLLFVGQYYECTVRLPNEDVLLLHAPRTSRLCEGQMVRVRIAEEGITIWPA